MRKYIFMAGLALAVAAPSLSNAATMCERANKSDRTTGTVIGGVAGALLGSAIAGNSSNTAGTVIGGVAGAIAGNQIAKRNNEPCPQGYYEYETQPVPAPAPTVYSYREYGPGYGGQPYNPDRFWAGAPTRIYDRIDFLQRRVRDGVDDGSLTRREFNRISAQVEDVRREAIRLDRRGRGFSPRDQQYLMDRLDRVSSSIAWARSNGNDRFGNRDRNDRFGSR